MFLANVLWQDDLVLFVGMAWAVWVEYCNRVHSVGRQKGCFNINWNFAYLESV